MQTHHEDHTERAGSVLLASWAVKLPHATEGAWVVACITKDVSKEREGAHREAMWCSAHCRSFTQCDLLEVFSQ